MSVASIKLGDLVYEVDERNPPPNTTVFSVSERFGIVPQSVIFQKKIAIDDLSKYKRVRYGDVVFNPYLLWNRAVGVCFQQEGGCVSPAYVVLRPRAKGTERFLHYFFRSARVGAAVDAIATGSVTRRRTAPVDDILSLEFGLPEIDSQKASSYFLTLIDDKIELTRHMNETLEAIGRAIFKSWFVDFDPVRIKAEGGDPGLPKEIVDLFPDSFEDSELRPIPKGWRMGILQEIAEVTSGKRPDIRNDIRDDVYQIPLLGGGGTMGYVRDPLYKQPIVLTGRVGTLGIVFRITYPCWPSDNTLVLSPLKTQWYEFIYHALSGFDFESLNRGSSQPLVTQSDLQKQRLVVPNVDIIEKFHLHIKALYCKVDANTKESDTLAALRDALLSKLISGELRVKDAGRFIGGQT